MSTIEYGTYSGPALCGDSLHRCLIDLQDATIRKHHFRRPGLSLDEYEDLYGRAVLKLFEKHPDASFPAPQAVVAWLDLTIERAAIDELRRRGRAREGGDLVSVTDVRGSDADPIAVQPVDGEPTPEQRVLLDEQALSLKEFIASLSPDDRKISLLHLHPGSRMKLKQIAAALDLPTTQVNTVLKRVDKRFSRYIALEVDEVCALRERDLVRWRQTGEMPVALRLHVKRCSVCNEKVQAARTSVHHSLLPMVGAVALPASGGAGLFSTLYRGSGVHPLVARAHVQLARVRKMGTFKAGGGTVVMTAKTVAVTAVLGTTAAVGGVTVVNSMTSSPPVQTISVTTPTTPATTSTAAVLTPPSTTTATTPTPTPTTTTTTSASTTTTASKTSTSETSQRLSPLGVANQSPIASGSAQSTGSSAHTAQALKSSPAAATRKSSGAGAYPTSSGGTSAPSKLSPLGQQSAAP